MPAFIIIIAWFWLSEKINFKQFTGVLITFLSVLVVVSSGDINALKTFKFNNGDIVMIFACTLYAVYAVGLRRKTKHRSSSFINFFLLCSIFGGRYLVYFMKHTQII